MKTEGGEEDEIINITGKPETQPGRAPSEYQEPPLKEKRKKQKPSN